MNNTIRNVAITRQATDGPYCVQVDDDRISVFEIDPKHVIALTEELAPGSWSAEVQAVPGLADYLRAHDIFAVDESENGFSVRTSEVIESRLKERLQRGPQWRDANESHLKGATDEQQR